MGKIFKETERKIQCRTKQEIRAALKLIELLYLQNEIPKHVYRNICNDYYGKGIDIAAGACYNVSASRDAV